MTGHWHSLLLSLAGVVDDAELAAARQALAAAARPASSVDVPGGIGRVVAAVGTRLTADELAAVALVARDVGASAAADALAHYGLRAPAYEWVALPGGSGLLGTDPAGWSDRAATTVVTALHDEPGVRGIWGVLRRGADDGDAARVFLVEVTGAAEPASLAGTAQARLVEAGRTRPGSRCSGATRPYRPIIGRRSPGRRCCGRQLRPRPSWSRSSTESTKRAGPASTVDVRTSTSMSRNRWRRTCTGRTRCC